MNKTYLIYGGAVLLAIIIIIIVMSSRKKSENESDIALVNAQTDLLEEQGNVAQQQDAPARRIDLQNRIDAANDLRGFFMQNLKNLKMNPTEISPAPGTTGTMTIAAGVQKYYYTRTQAGEQIAYYDNKIIEFQTSLDNLLS